MLHTGLVLLNFLAIITIVKMQIECDSTMCTNVCEKETSGDGTCNGNSCDCSYGKNCSAMVEVTCGIACKGLDLDGECDENGQCICKAELEPCPLWDCEEQCLEDPRAVECELMFGVVTPVACLEYGPIRTCGCLCTYLVTNRRSNSVHKKTFNYYPPVAKIILPKNSSKLVGYSVIGK